MILHPDTGRPERAGQEGRAEISRGYGRMEEKQGGEGGGRRRGQERRGEEPRGKERRVGGSEGEGKVKDGRGERSSDRKQEEERNERWNGNMLDQYREG